MRKKLMKLNKNDRIKYDDSIYVVVAVIWSTVYLCAIEDGTTNYDYEINVNILDGLTSAVR